MNTSMSNSHIQLYDVKMNWWEEP